jgi:predicted enzyme related to lactoylglutathione lyase
VPGNALSQREEADQNWNHRVGGRCRARDRHLADLAYADSCDEAVERLRAAGATVTEEPADQPWGERVARVLDPDGNEVIVGQRA